MVARLAAKPPLYTSLLVYIALQAAFFSFLLSYYGFEIGPVIRPPLLWAAEQLKGNSYANSILEATQNLFTEDEENVGSSPKPRQERPPKIKKTSVNLSKMDALQADVSSLPIFTREQLTLFDGSRPSKGVYLALLGRVYNVEKGRRHYAPGGGYHFFAGKDATRAFVTGDFSESGLVEDVTGLGHQDLLGILDWINFYENGYQLVGVLKGTYYDKDGRPTQRLWDVMGQMEDALRWKDSQAQETEIFPPCNSEWHNNLGGRVWCSAKSGGIHREWVGVPRRLFSPGTKTYRCACVKDFGTSLSGYPGADEKGNRGDLDNPNIREYPGCKPSSISCKIERD